MARTDAPNFFDALPPELVPLVVRFLSGFDVLPLSSANKTFHTKFLGPTSTCWARHAPPTLRIGPYEWHALAVVGWTHVRSLARYRLAHDREAARLRREQRLALQVQERELYAQELLTDAKRRYFESVSVWFPGLLHGKDDTVHARRQWTDARVTLPDHAIHDQWTHHSFSFDLWMALLPGASSRFSSRMTGESHTVGGVVFSAQSSHWDDGDAASPLATNLVHVDELGGLYCSVASGAKRVLATLSLSRWYHVALTFDRSVGSGETTAEQRVYLDGECIDTQRGELRLPEHWSQFGTFELGTGFMDADAVGLPEVQERRRSRSHSGLGWFKGAFRHWRSASPQFRGNYPFHGLLDEFRLWRGVLSSKDLARLARGRDPQVEVSPQGCAAVACTWSLTADANYHSFHGDLWGAKCTRPTERWCEHVTKIFRLRSHDELLLLH